MPTEKYIVTILDQAEVIIITYVLTPRKNSVLHIK